MNDWRGEHLLKIKPSDRERHSERSRLSVALCRINGKNVGACEKVRQHHSAVVISALTGARNLK